MPLSNSQLSLLRVILGIPLVLLAGLGLMQGHFQLAFATMVAAVFLALNPDWIKAKTRISYWEILAVLLVVAAVLVFRDLYQDAYANF